MCLCRCIWISFVLLVCVGCWVCNVVGFMSGGVGYVVIVSVRISVCWV